MSKTKPHGVKPGRSAGDAMAIPCVQEKRERERWRERERRKKKGGEKERYVRVAVGAPPVLSHEAPVKVKGDHLALGWGLLLLRRRRFGFGLLRLVRRLALRDELVCA